MAAAGSDDLDTAFDAILGSLNTVAQKPAPTTVDEPVKPAPKQKASFEEIDALTNALLNPIVIKKSAAGRPPPSMPNPRSPRADGQLSESTKAASPRAASASVAPQSPKIVTSPPPAVEPPPALPPFDPLQLPPPSFLVLPPPPTDAVEDQSVGTGTSPGATSTASGRTPSPGRITPASAAPPVHSSTLNKWLNKSSTAKPAATAADTTPASPDPATVTASATGNTAAPALGTTPPSATTLPPPSGLAVSTPPPATSLPPPNTSPVAFTPPPATSLPVSISSTHTSGIYGTSNTPPSGALLPPFSPPVAKTQIEYHVTEATRAVTKVPVQHAVTTNSLHAAAVAKQLIPSSTSVPSIVSIAKQSPSTGADLGLSTSQEIPSNRGSPLVQPAAPNMAKQPVRPTSAFDTKGASPLPKSSSNTTVSTSFMPVLVAANKEELVLHDAVKSGQQARVMEVLGRNKALVNVRNSSEQSPLHVGAQLGHVDICNLVIANGGQVDAVDHSSWAAIHYAGAGGHMSIVRLLATAGANVGLRNDVGCTVLHYLMAIQVPKADKALFRITVMDTVRALGFDINARNNSGATAAHQASFRGRRWNLKVLLVHNPNVSIASRIGETPLHHAARRGDVKMVQLLLDKGADPDVKADTGTALDLAHAFKHEPVVAMLLPITKVPLTNVEATYDDLWKSQTISPRKTSSAGETTRRKPDDAPSPRVSSTGDVRPPSITTSPSAEKEETGPPPQKEHKDKKESQSVSKRLSTMFASKKDTNDDTISRDLRGSSPGSIDSNSTSVAGESKSGSSLSGKASMMSKRLSMALFKKDGVHKEEKKEGSEKKDEKKEEKKDGDKEKKEEKKEEKEKKEREEKDKDKKEKKEKEKKEKKSEHVTISAPIPKEASGGTSSPVPPTPTPVSTPSPGPNDDTLRRTHKKKGVFGSISHAFDSAFDKKEEPGKIIERDIRPEIIPATKPPVDPTVPTSPPPASVPRTISNSTPPTSQRTLANSNGTLHGTPPSPTDVASPAVAVNTPNTTTNTNAAGSPAVTWSEPAPAAVPRVPSYVSPSPRPGASIVDTLFQTLDPHERDLLVSSPQFKRQKVLEEIITTEREYVSDMDYLIQLFLLPMRAKSVIHSTDLTDIFSNVEEIYEVNKSLLASLERGDPIGSAFLGMSEKLKNYSVYMANQDHSTSSLERCKKTYPDLNPFLTSVFDANPQLRNSNLDNMLIKPVQRLCKYPLLLDQLLKYTATTDLDQPNLEKAKLAIEKVCEYVDVKILEYASRMKLQEIEPQISDLPESFSLVPPSTDKHQRQYVKEWECRVSSKGDQRPSKIYLFDDMLMWTAAGLLDNINMMTWSKKKLRYRDHVPFTELLFKEVSGQLAITHVGVREFTLCPETEFDKYQWKADIEKAVDDLLRRNYNDIYGAIPESDRVSFADYKKNLQRQLEFIPLPLEIAKRGVSTRKENEVFALGSVALSSDPPATPPPSTQGGSGIYVKREQSPTRGAPASLPGVLTVPQIQAATGRNPSPKRPVPAPPSKPRERPHTTAMSPLPSSPNSEMLGGGSGSAPSSVPLALVPPTLPAALSPLVVRPAPPEEEEGLEAR